MTEQQNKAATRLAAAKNELHEAILAATVAGLKVEVEVGEYRSIGEHPRPIVIVEASIPLHLD